MITVETLVFNPFQVNTYLLYDESLECVIIDAACYEKSEQDKLSAFITSKNLKPVKHLITHCHIDHIMGSEYMFEKFKLSPIIHKAGLQFLQSAVEYGAMYGFTVGKIPEPLKYIEDNDVLSFGLSALQVIYTPGHANGSVCFYSAADKFVVVGDVLFKSGMGRTDLPTGNHELLIQSINKKLFTLPEETKVFPGHGPYTTIGFEKRNNPFIN